MTYVALFTQNIYTYYKVYKSIYILMKNKFGTAKLG